MEVEERGLVTEDVLVYPFAVLCTQCWLPDVTFSLGRESAPRSSRRPGPIAQAVEQREGIFISCSFSRGFRDS